MKNSVNTTRVAFSTVDASVMTRNNRKCKAIRVQQAKPSAIQREFITQESQYYVWSLEQWKRKVRICDHMAGILTD